MRLLYGPGNPAKLEAMQRRMEPLHVEVIGLNDIDMEIPEIEEDGATPLENATKKALGYYKAFYMPVFSCDSGLYIDGISEDEQPGLHVRTANGKYFYDLEESELDQVAVEDGFLEFFRELIRERFC